MAQEESEPVHHVQETQIEVVKKDSSKLKMLKESTSNFFGLSKQNEDNEKVWKKRRIRIASSFGSGLNQSYVDKYGATQIPDQEHPQMETDVLDGQKKKSVLQFSLSVMAEHKKRRQKSKDNSKPRSRRRSSRSKSRSSYIRRASMVSQRQSDASQLPMKSLKDYELSVSGIKSLLVDMTMRREKRQLGIGIVGLYLQRRLRSSVEDEFSYQIDNFYDYRPYFTYWITFVQTVVTLIAVLVYGIAPLGIGTTYVSENVHMPNLAIQTEYFIERDNMWLGPRQYDLVHLGAKYSLCMRKDVILYQAIGLDREIESASACCIRKDGSGCVQTIKARCDPILSSWKKWSNSYPGPDSRVSGSVCGQDPGYCQNPISAPPFAWPDQITKWPICLKTATVNMSIQSMKKKHMYCEILGKPCCYGIRGECIITTHEHCSLLRGYFHPEASLCSQINCFQEACGMFPFADSEDPDQFYRLLSSLFLHAGLLHLGISIMYQMWIMRDVEKLLGSVRTFIIYIWSGVGANLASCLLFPYNVEVGPSGAQFGIAACLLVEVIQSIQMFKHPRIAVLKLCALLFSFFVLGFLPWFNNITHIFGFLFGFLLTFFLMPYVTFGKIDRYCKIITMTVCLGIAIGLFALFLVMFYTYPSFTCEWCVYLSCIPFRKDFCENLVINFRNRSTYIVHV